MENWLLVPIGIIIASFASLIGIGGGLLWAPYFILGQGFDPPNAILFSFLIQFVGMGSATFWNIRHKNIYWKLVIYFLPVIVLGVIAGAFLNQRVADPQLLKGMLGIVSIFVSIYFAFQTERYDAVFNLDRTITPTTRQQGQSFVFGCLSGLFSVGITDFLVPVMRRRLKIPMKYSIGTSLLLNFCLALVGAATHLAFSQDTPDMEMVNILMFSWIGVFIGGQLGPKLANIMDESSLK
jgi:uncharacterized membrane protein YfcA